MLQQLLSAAADATDPLLAVIGLLFPWLERHACSRRFGRRWKVWRALLLALLVVYGLRFVDDTFSLWPRFGLDYSTHTAFAVAIVTVLASTSRRWLFWLTAVLIGYAFLLIYFGYHSVSDIVSTAVIIASASALIVQLTAAVSPTQEPNG